MNNRKLTLIFLAFVVISLTGCIDYDNNYDDTQVFNSSYDYNNNMIDFSKEEQEIGNLSEIIRLSENNLRSSKDNYSIVIDKKLKNETIESTILKIDLKNKKASGKVKMEDQYLIYFDGTFLYNMTNRNHSHSHSTDNHSHSHSTDNHSINKKITTIKQISSSIRQGNSLQTKISLDEKYNESGKTFYKYVSNNSKYSLEFEISEDRIVRYLVYKPKSFDNSYIRVNYSDINSTNVSPKLPKWAESSNESVEDYLGI
jgi:aminoglycoside N3'-acetyltransferase